jgi:hypothetical protein
VTADGIGRRPALDIDGLMARPPDTLDEQTVAWRRRLWEPVWEVSPELGVERSSTGSTLKSMSTGRSVVPGCASCRAESRSTFW